MVIAIVPVQGQSSKQGGFLGFGKTYLIYIFTLFVLIASSAARANSSYQCVDLFMTREDDAAKAISEELDIQDSASHWRGSGQ